VLRLARSSTGNIFTDLNSFDPIGVQGVAFKRYQIILFWVHCSLALYFLVSPEYHDEFDLLMIYPQYSLQQEIGQVQHLSIWPSSNLTRHCLRIGLEWSCFLKIPLWCKENWLCLSKVERQFIINQPFPNWF